MICISRDGIPIPLVENFEGGKRPIIIFVHGLAGDRNEVGDIFRVADERLAKHDFASVRFDFRGHGESELPSQYTSIRGECLDLTAVVSHVSKLTEAPLYFIAASLGAIPLLLTLASYERSVAAVALWNPVLRPFETFCDPGTDWSESVFAGLRDQPSAGYVSLDGFKFGRPMYADFCDVSVTGALDKALAGLTSPMLLVHGTEDAIVPFVHSELVARRHDNVEIYPVIGASHGLSGYHDEIIDLTVRWFRDRRGMPATSI